VGKRSIFEKLKKMAATKIFCECGNAAKGFVYLKTTFRCNDAV
jgi:hypothetical protein